MRCSEYKRSWDIELPSIGSCFSVPFDAYRNGMSVSKLVRRNSRTLGIASSEDSALPSGVPPKIIGPPVIGCGTAARHEGAI